MASANGFPISECQRNIEAVPQETLQLPQDGASFRVDQRVVDAFPEPGSKLIEAIRYAQSLGSTTAKLKVQLPEGVTAQYFLKVFTDPEARSKCEGEYAALEAIAQASPGLAPKAHAWGQMGESTGAAYFLLEDFLPLREQPADPERLAAGLAKLHQQSQSPCEKFGFHLRTWHGGVCQDVGRYDQSWSAIFGQHIRYIMDISMLKPEKLRVNINHYGFLCNLIVETVIPRLLGPLQSDGRSLKPCLVHGDCWDGNTGIDAESGFARIFDVCSFYAHNEYDTGNWRAPRHRVSIPTYIEHYKTHIPPSVPVEDWAARQLLYSLCFNIGNIINVPNSPEGPVVYHDMLTLCRTFCPEKLRAQLPALDGSEDVPQQ